MKKIIIGLSLLFLSTNCYAGTFTPAYISNDSSATPAIIDSNFKGFADAFNGNVEGSNNGTSVLNIKADSVYEINMADDANPRLRDSEILNIGADSVSGGTLTQAAFVESGLVPADTANLTSDISAGTAYINGYRVTKSATSQTYTASRDTYVDLSQTGVFTLSAVTNGAAQPSVAANSVRLAKVVTDGTQITSVTTLYVSRVPGLVIPSNYRDGLFISRDSATTITVFPGSAEINNSMIQKTATTTLTLTTAGDWAGGSSLQAVSTHGYVGMDASGNLKMHTTKPSHDNYGVSTTAGKKRYATWSSTVYRILGWFYMNATGSGELDTFGVSNIQEGDTPNVIVRSGVVYDTLNDTSYGNDITETTFNFYTTGNNPTTFQSILSGDIANASTVWTQLLVDSANEATSETSAVTPNQAGDEFQINNLWTKTLAEGTHTLQLRGKVSTGSVIIKRKQIKIYQD